MSKLSLLILLFCGQWSWGSLRTPWELVKEGVCSSGVLSLGVCCASGIIWASGDRSGMGWWALEHPSQVLVVFPPVLLFLWAPLWVCRWALSLNAVSIMTKTLSVGNTEFSVCCCMCEMNVHLFSVHHFMILHVEFHLSFCHPVISIQGLFAALYCQSWLFGPE